MKTLDIAHRGGAALWPENTPPAFGEAIALGCDGAELDVQLSADGIVIVHHDFRLNPGYARLRGGDWVESPGPRIKDLTLHQLWQYDLGHVRPGSDYARSHPDIRDAGGTGVPTLEWVVNLAKEASDFRLLVELKCDLSEDSADPVALADAALAVVEDADFLSRTIFVGFDWRALARVKQKQPKAEIWCTTDEKIAGDAGLFEIILGLGAAGWFPHYAQLTDQAAALARSYGFKLGAWTVNDETEMRRLLALGVDAICTDRPDLLQAFK